VKYYLTFTILFGAMFGWQVFLIQRDSKMFDVYEHRQQQIEALTNSK